MDISVFTGLLRFSGVNEYGSVHKFNLNTSLWTEVASLNQGRIFHTAEVCNGRIYVIGGLHDSDEDTTQQKTNGCTLTFCRKVKVLSQ